MTDDVRAPAVATTDLPAIFRAADESSQVSQRSFLTAVGVRLCAALLAAAFGGVAIADGRAWAVFAGISFGVALIVELYLLKTKPDKDWYDGRAVAESSKTLAWRFMVGGSPFGIGEPAPKAERQLLERFTTIARELPGPHLIAQERHGEQITAAMREVRTRPLPDRRELYRRGRIAEQRGWYAAKARRNQRAATAWTVGLAGLEAVGLTGAIVKAAGLVNVDLLGLAGALVAAGVAWLQTKQYQTLASAYSVAAQELLNVGARADHITTEQEWADFVEHAEDAISREHTMWRASHT